LFIKKEKPTLKPLKYIFFKQFNKLNA